MARQVRCHDTGLLADRDTSYKAADGKYYSSEAAFNRIREEREWRKKVYALLIEIFGFQKDYVPPIYKREIASFDKFGLENVYLAIRYVRKDIEWALANKEFKSEYAQARYISVIIGSAIGEVIRLKAKDERIKRQQDKLIKNDTIPEDTTLAHKDRPAPDISRFLGSDE